MVDRLRELILPVVHSFGMELWGIERATSGKSKILRIYIDGSAGVTIDDCVRVSRQISSMLEVEDPLSAKYILEVSSPGLERRLFEVDQYCKYIGEMVRVNLRNSFENRRNYLGRLVRVENEEIIIVSKEEEFTFPFEMIEKGHLVYEG
ncbi:MAG: ribosome maturation factor RimP [Gammaproteobacteria bacterium]|nr:ribosome maturation factor RimP [Gammaproteobacteria bacterium]|tara:strand:+ start:904 stop:1350 length:447 start_codon:yes stop_codon:yes gene_type:complete